MRVFRTEGTEDSPKIILDKENNVFEIAGKSLPEDVLYFYTPVIKWLNEYAEDPLDETVFSFKMEYYNTASSRFLLNIMLVLGDIQKDGHKVFVRWFYPHNDAEIEEGGKDYFSIVNLPHEIIPMPDLSIQSEPQEASPAPETEPGAETVPNDSLFDRVRRFFSSKSPESDCNRSDS